MAIKFFNIRSRETVVAETEPQITALWASSDRSPNITQGQDFGWRFAPEVVVQMKKIKQDVIILSQIAARTNRPLEDIGEPEILQYISSQTLADQAPSAESTDFEDEYDAEIRRLERKEKEKKIAVKAPVQPKVKVPITTTTTTQKT